MLGRIAEIYGLYLDDKAQALSYAEKAAAINPGQPALRSAFNAAGIEYDTSEYEDLFIDVIDNYDTPQKPIGKIAGEMTTFAGVSPNPFNPYSLAEDGHVSLAIYNLSGQKVATLVDSSMPAGTHQARFDGSGLASGMYFYRFESGSVMRNGKMLLMK